jgi:molybdenum cofactor guanylyltransferase
MDARRKLTKADFGAIILAGGKSSRMGQDKGLVNLCDVPMLQWVINAVEPLVSEIFIIANSPTYTSFGYPVLPDAFPDTGPLGGLVTGLQAMDRRWSFVLSCDVPLIQTATLLAMQKALQGRPCIAATSQFGKEPLISIFEKSILAPLKANLLAERLKMEATITAIGGTFVELEMLQGDFDPKSLTNFNTMEQVLAYDCGKRST